MAYHFQIPALREFKPAIVSLLDGKYTIVVGSHHVYNSSFKDGVKMRLFSDNSQKVPRN